MDNIQIVNNIKRLCNEKNISISQLEKELNLSTGLISRWKEKTPTLERLVDIATRFNVSIDTLINGEEFSQTESKISLLIQALYQKTQRLEIDWRVLDINNPPMKFNKLVYNILSNRKCDYYCAIYKNGCFILSALYDDSTDKLSLHVIPDSYSIPQLICRDYDKIDKLFELVSINLRKELNIIKTNKFIDSFLEDTNVSSHELNDNSVNSEKNYQVISGKISKLG